MPYIILLGSSFNQQFVNPGNALPASDSGFNFRGKCYSHFIRHLIWNSAPKASPRNSNITNLFPQAATVVPQAAAVVPQAAVVVPQAAAVVPQAAAVVPQVEHDTGIGILTLRSQKNSRFELNYRFLIIQATMHTTRLQWFRPELNHLRNWVSRPLIIHFYWSLLALTY